ncbi:MAG: Ig-like domain-containing protein [Clostridia bacterium]|nr:Ig-like domain-containing protein [Clostridia bacterium]
MKSIETLNQKLNPLRHFKPKQKQLFRLGCAALALALAVGTVPFLRGWAANEQAVVSDSDSVSGTDTVITNSITVEPKPAKSMIGGINWQRADSLDDLNNAALSSKSAITLSLVSNWVTDHLDTFAEENGYEDPSKLCFVSDYTGSQITVTYRSQYGLQMVSSAPGNFSSFTIFYIPRIPSTSFTLSHTRLDLNVGDVEMLTGEFQPADTNDKVVWSSNSRTVVSVENNGEVTAVGCGSATITAKVYNDVYEIPVTVSGHAYIDPYNMEASDWVRATSWEDLANAAFLGRSNVNTWRASNQRAVVGGVPVKAALLVYQYNSADGGTAYYVSTRSGTVTEATFDTTKKYFYIPKPAASYTYHPAQPATCTQHATIAYWTDQYDSKFLDCNGNNSIDSIYDETSPLGDHVWGEWVVTREPTCGEAGEKKHTCSECNTFETEPIDPDPTKHSLTHHNAVAATCTAAGTKEYWECSLCHKQYANEMGTEELTSLTADALGHEWGSEAWNWAADYSSASVTLTCGRCHAEKTLTDNAPHIGTVVSQPTCTENKVVRYVANVQDDEDDSVFYSATSVDVEVANTALGHTWEWVTDTEPTETDPGEKHEECTVCHAKQNEHTEIRAQPDDYSFTDDSTFKWKKGSKDGLKMVVKNTSGDDRKTFGKFKDVYVDEKMLTRDTDYTAQAGSIEITLSAAYLEGLSTGEHTLKVELTVTNVEHTFTVVAPAASDTPATGESGMSVAVSIALMLLAAYGGVYAVSRRRRVVG